jgi:hypothetical protein
MAISVHSFEAFKRRASEASDSKTLGQKFMEEFYEADPRVCKMRDAQDGSKLADIRRDIENCTNPTTLYWKLVSNNLVSMAR